MTKQRVYFLLKFFDSNSSHFFSSAEKSVVNLFSALTTCSVGGTSASCKSCNKVVNPVMKQ